MRLLPRRTPYTVFSTMAGVSLLMPQATAAEAVFTQVSSPRSSSESPVAVLRVKDGGSFYSTLQSLAERSDCCFVVEGQPLHPASPAARGKGAANRGQDEVIFSGDTEEAVVQQIAAAYGYRAATREAGLFVLTKTYADPADLPSVTLEELGVTLADLRKISAAFSPRMSGNAGPGSLPVALSALTSSLTPEQVQRLPNEMGGVPVTELSAAQRRAVQELSAYFFVRIPLEDLRPIEQHWDRLHREGTYFGFSLIEGQQFFGYSYPVKPAGVATPAGVAPSFWFVQLNNPIGMMTTGRVTIPQESRGVGDLSHLSDPDSPDSRETEDTLKLSVVYSLREACALLKRRATERNSRATYSVSEELAEKRVTLIGVERRKPAVLFRTIAEVYGLRVLRETQEGEAWRLSRHRAAVPSSLAQLPAAVLRALPEPLIRAYRAQSAGHAGELTDTGLRFTALKRFRTILEPMVKTAEEHGKRVTLEEVPEEAQQALAVHLGTGVAEVFQQTSVRRRPDM